MQSDGNKIIRVDALGKTVPNGATGLTILEDISFDIDAAEAVAIVGVSGSGKSTLLGLVAGLDMPTAGRVHLNGHDLFALDEDGRAHLRARTIGFVFQSFQLLPAMTALENVMLAARVRGGHPDAARRGRELIDELGLRRVAGSTPAELSGGEQQRFAIARALVNDPRLLLADEPTGNLDASAARDVLRLMRDVADGGRSVILVTHDEAATGIADRVLRLDGGQLVPC